MRTQLLKQAITTTKKLLKSLPKNADSIAVQLYREGVRGAVCGNMKRCALAQYIANKLPKGITVYVSGFGIDLTDKVAMKIAVKAGDDPSDTLATVDTNERINNFIDSFDSKAYPFLQKIRNKRNKR